MTNRLNRPIVPLLLLPLLMASPAYAGDDVDHEQAYALVQQGRILPLAEILARHPQLAQVRLLEVELEQKHGRYLYELSFVTPSGQVLEWKLDAQSGTRLTQPRHH
ncbi:membrane protein [Magnetococcus marinus MC-1]|uniref:Membrane protein n=1 Tax=Magnetococcus marinus (strain ATCC BAA-1437 / JCM 17883 / MC-1) TaxID=156889 RepID=A0L4E7_MAGMM|nr:membrane protein [Magnetococcus marinus]ABK42840.1 membrane protein [Magnetococcus marinus MC-1]